MCRSNMCTETEYIFKTITDKDELWDKVISFAQKCSWRAGKSLAEKMKNKLFKNWERIIVVTYNNNIAAFCTVTEKDSIKELEYTPYIGYLFIDESYRGQYLSEKIIKYASEYVKSIGFNKVYIISGEIGLYEKYGFIKIDEKEIKGSIEQIFIKNL